MELRDGMIEWVGRVMDWIAGSEQEDVFEPPLTPRRHADGRAIRIELDAADRTGKLCASLGRLSCVRDVAVDGRDVFARLFAGKHAVQAVLSTVDAHGLTAVRMRDVPPLSDE